MCNLAVPELKRFVCPRCGQFFEALCGINRYAAELRCPACRGVIRREAGVREPAPGGAARTKKFSLRTGPYRAAL